MLRYPPTFASSFERVPKGREMSDADVPTTKTQENACRWPRLTARFCVSTVFWFWPPALPWRRAGTNLWCGTPGRYLRDHLRERHSSFEPHFLVEKLMGIKLRPLMATLFCLLGLIPAAYGTLTDTSRYRHSPGMNDGLVPEIVAVAFTLVVVVLNRRRLRVALQKCKSHSLESSGH
jgi:hypothetical protein